MRAYRLARLALPALLGPITVIGTLACSKSETVDPRVQSCKDAVSSLGTELAGVDGKLRDALKANRAEAARLLRGSVELVLVTRELLCQQAPPEKVREPVAKLETTRKAYDALLAATQSAQPAPNEAELVDRFSRALLGQ